jgi:hypothetical protein
LPVAASIFAVSSRSSGVSAAMPGMPSIPVSQHTHECTSSDAGLPWASNFRMHLSICAIVHDPLRCEPGVELRHQLGGTRLLGLGELIDLQRWAAVLGRRA